MQTNALTVIEFLTCLYHQGLNYSSINVARSALSSFVIMKGTATVGNHSLISRFMKGIFSLRPPVPRYEVIWDVNIVLDFLRKLAPIYKLSLKQLTLKLTMLIALVTAQRAQTLKKLKISNLRYEGSSAIFRSSEFLKQTRPGHMGFTLSLRDYPPDRRLCLVHYLKFYLNVTKKLRNGEDQLFVSFRKPHGPVSKDTISRWLAIVLKQAGVNIEQFRPHSTRAASTSAADKLGVPIQEIMRTAGWSKAATFQQYYNKPIQQEDSCMMEKLLQER